MAAESAAPAVRRRAVRTGVVVSSKMDKTVVVAVERPVPHPRYVRAVRRTTKFYAHDEKNACKPGDVVTIVETRPMSRLKRWRVRSVLREGRPLLDEALEAAAALPDPGVPRRRRKAAVAPEQEAAE